MKKIFGITAVCMLTLFSVFAQNRAPENIVGIWSSEDGHIKIEIYKAGPQYFGKQIWGESLYEASGNETLRRRDLNNLIILNNFDYDAGEYNGGTFYDHKTGKRYKSIIRLHGSNVLKIRDYTVVSLFGKTTTWTRVQQP